MTIQWFQPRGGSLFELYFQRRADNSKASLNFIKHILDKSSAEVRL